MLFIVFHSAQYLLIIWGGGLGERTQSNQYNMKNQDPMFFPSATQEWKKWHNFIIYYSKER